MRLGDLGELGAHGVLEELLVIQDRAQRLDLTLEIGALGLQLDPGELRQAAQLQVEDVACLRLGEVEDVDESLAGDAGIIR